MPARSRLWLALWLLLCATLAFAGNLGHGFIGEDFEWLRTGSVRSAADARAAALTPVAGHYRPLVAATFVINHLLSGLSPLGHGLVNLGLACAAASVVGLLAAAHGLGFVGAAIAATLWLFNPDTVGPATTAIVGRSQLLAALWAAAAAVASMYGRRGPAALFAAAAVASHETMWPLPLVLAAWIAIDRRTTSIAAAARSAAPMGAAVAAVVLLRLAILGTDGAAGSVGRPAAPALPNGPEALGVLGLAFAAATAALGVTLGPALHLERGERSAWLMGIVWMAVGAVHAVVGIAGQGAPALDPTSLSVGAAVTGAAIGRAAARRLGARRPLVWVGALLIPLIAVPLHWQRNSAGRADARLASRVLQRLFVVLAERPDIRRVELYQAMGETPSIASALGPGVAAALELGTGRTLETGITLASPGDPWPSPRAFTVRLTVVEDEIVAVAPPLEP